MLVNESTLLKSAATIKKRENLVEVESLEEFAKQLGQQKVSIRRFIQQPTTYTYY
jgi:hypothetical protein